MHLVGVGSLLGHDGKPATVVDRAPLGSGVVDTMGDADELGHDEDLPEQAAPLLTVEGRAIAGAGLVLMSTFATSIFQFVGFLIFNQNGQGVSPTTQYVLIAGPAALLAGAGAALAWSTRRQHLSPGLRGIAGAAVVVGVAVAALVVISIIAGYAFGPENSSTF
jgi:hypothetical protein